MKYTVATCLVRQAIDNRLNRDLVAQAREQGFVFSDPFADAVVWKRLEIADLENPIQRCNSEETEWLSVKAIEASLFFIYQQSRHSIGQHINV